jgi:heme-degrading monooxygenase HmoA
MILEVAEFRIDPARRADFEAALQRGAATVVAMAAGYHGHAILRCVESEDRYLLHARWSSVEAHNVGFRGSPAFADWRAIAGPFFAASPVVAHHEWVADAIRAPRELT